MAMGHSVIFFSPAGKWGLNPANTSLLRLHLIDGIALLLPGVNTAFKGLDIVISHVKVFLHQPGRGCLVGSITIKDKLLISVQR